MSVAAPTKEYLAEDTGCNLTIVASIFTALLFLFAGARLLAQRMKGRPFGLDDLFSYVGMLFILGECIIAIIMVPFAGAGRHLAYNAMNAPEKLIHEYVIIFPIEMVYISSFTFPKISILWFYLRIFISKWMVNTTYTLIAIVVATWIAETSSAIFQCWPIRFMWDKTIDGHCVNQQALIQFWSIPNIITDAVMLVLPLPIVWRLHMSPVQKIGLTFTLLLGSIGIVASVVRFAIFCRTAAFEDATWAAVDLQIWTIVEPSMYFFAGILPTLRPIVSIFFSGIRTTVTLTKQFHTKASSNRSHCHIEGDQTVNSSGGNKSSGPYNPWEAIDDDSYNGGDNLILYECSPNIVGGFDRGSSEGDRKDDTGIKRTQEVMVTRDIV